MWRVLVEGGELHEVYVTPKHGHGFIASCGDEDDGADCLGASPREAVTQVAASMTWAVRQVLSPDDMTVDEARREAAAAMREAVALAVEAGGAIDAGTIRALPLLGAPS